MSQDNPLLDPAREMETTCDLHYTHEECVVRQAENFSMDSLDSGIEMCWAESNITVKVLVLTQCLNLDLEAARRLVRAYPSIEALIVQPPVDRTEAESGAYSISDVGVLDCFTSAWPQLRALSLPYCTIRRELHAAFGTVLAKATQLHLLHVPHAPVTDAVLEKLSKHCRTLRVVDISGNDATEAGFVALARASPQLRILCTDGAHFTSDEAFAAVAESCPKLRVLSAEHTVGFGSAAFRALGENCRDLRILRARVTESVSRDTFSKFFTKCRAIEQLRVTDMDDCYGLSEGMFDHCPRNLRVLEFIHCGISTLAAQSIIGWYHEDLDKISFHGCWNVTDELYTGSFCTGRIAHIDISGCSRINHQMARATFDRYKPSVTLVCDAVY